MADYRQIHTCIWKDPWFQELGKDYKLLFIYLFSNERANVAGLYDISLRTIAFETELEMQTIEDGLALFEQEGKVYREGHVLWVTNLLHHNCRNITSPKIQAHLKTLLEAAPDCELKRLWIEHYNGIVPSEYCMDTLSIPYPESESEHEQEHDHEQEQDHLKGADAPPQVPRSFPEWESYLGTVKNHPALVQRMCRELYPGKEPPSFGLAGKVAKQMGRGIDGYRRLMGLLWEYSTRPPQGDLLPYLLRVHQGKERDNGSHSSADKARASPEVQERAAQIAAALGGRRLGSGGGSTGPPLPVVPPPSGADDQ